MGFRINTNVYSLFAQRVLTKSRTALSRSLERLASGKRITQASDDAAGLAIATGIDSQKRGVLQAIRNINDAKGLMGTTEGALSSQTAIVQRMKELATQAANGVLSSNDRSYLDSEFQKLYQEFDRITQQSLFGDVNLLDGSQEALTLQVGSRSSEKISISPTSAKSSEVFTKEAGTGTFAAAQTIISGLSLADDSYNGTATGDFNGDGKSDIATSIGQTLYIYKGVGDGTYQLSSTLFEFTGKSQMATGDFNNDGKLDLIWSSNSTGVIGVALGNGDGTFKTTTPFTAGNYDSHFAIGDFNGDGKLDFMKAQGGAPAIIRLGNGDGTFSVGTTLSTTWHNATRPVAYDFDRDGKIDLVDENFTSLYFLKGNGDGTFQAPVQSTLPTNGFGDIAVGDLNGDGFADVVCGSSQSSGTTTVSVALGNANGTFKPGTLLTTGNGGYVMHLADLNDDGNLDLVSSVSGGSTTVLLGKGDGTFSSPQTLLASGTNYNAILDTDGDGFADILAGNGTNSVSFKGNHSTQSATSNLSISTQARAQKVLNILDTGLKNLLSKRSYLGAVSNRLDTAASSSGVLTENLAAAQSAVMDSDFALETAELTRNQILEKAGVGVLGQANVQMQIVIQLLNPK